MPWVKDLLDRVLSDLNDSAPYTVRPHKNDGRWPEQHNVASMKLYVTLVTSPVTTISYNAVGM